MKSDREWIASAIIAELCEITPATNFSTTRIAFPALPAKVTLNIIFSRSLVSISYPDLVLDLVLFTEVNGGLVSAFGGQRAIGLGHSDLAFRGVNPSKPVEG